MSLWLVVVNRDFPVWTLAHRLIRREGLENGRVKWLLEGSEALWALPTSSRGVISIESAEIDLDSVGISARSR